MAERTIMKIGPYEIQLKELNSTWRYRITSLKTGEIMVEGYRPNEHTARNAGLEDAAIVATYCR